MRFGYFIDGYHIRFVYSDPMITMVEAVGRCLDWGSLISRLPSNWTCSKSYIACVALAVVEVYSVKVRNLSSSLKVRPTPVSFCHLNCERSRTRAGLVEVSKQYQPCRNSALITNKVRIYYITTRINVISK